MMRLKERDQIIPLRKNIVNAVHELSVYLVYLVAA